jgi:pyruvate formate lyase activating enzyme
MKLFRGTEMNVEGWIFDIQRFSLHDGPGIRTTVFLKGCPLRCKWCHNPEGQEQQPQIRLTMSLCKRCGACERTCEREGHEVNSEGHALHLAHCARCGKCVEACPSAALELVGRRTSVEEVMAAVRRDIPFYDETGGVTLSGGEPLSQLEFSEALLAAAKAEGIHTAVDTSAHAPWECLEELAAVVDLFVVDLKHTDDARHRALTGVSNGLILANIGRMLEAGWPVVLRVPWVPTLNAEESFLAGLRSFLGAFSNCPTVEFMPYHRLGLSKRAGLGAAAASEDIPAATVEQIRPWMDSLRAAGISVKVAR